MEVSKSSSDSGKTKKFVYTPASFGVKRSGEGNGTSLSSSSSGVSIWVLSGGPPSFKPKVSHPIRRDKLHQDVLNELLEVQYSSFLGKRKRKVEAKEEKGKQKRRREEQEGEGKEEEEEESKEDLSPSSLLLTEAKEESGRWKGLKSRLLASIVKES